MRSLLLCTVLLICSPVFSQTREWNCRMHLQEEVISFKIIRDQHGEFSLMNGSEVVSMEKKIDRGDSAEYALSVFDARLVFPRNPGNTFQGWYRKGDAKIPSSGLLFEAAFNTSEPAREIPDDKTSSSRWPIEFLEGDKVSEKGILLLNQKGSQISGSILTPTGDYRFLNGEIKGTKAYLQTFDGGHAWYFRMEFPVEGNSLKGEFLYSQSGKQSFRGIRNDQAELESGFSKPEVKNSLHFSATDASGIKISEANFKGKALVIQVLGSWCPNCLDETRFLSEEYASRPAGIEFLGLAFERKNDAAYVNDRIATVKRKLTVPYPIYGAGMANKDSASKALPEAGGIKAFPTTLFVKKNGEILKVHSGFSGPATGAAYDAWRKEFREILKQLEN